LPISLVVAAAYLIGSIPFALLLARRLAAVDLREVGSGNLGAANLLRVSGTRAGLLAAALDAAKGAAGVAIAARVEGGTLAPALAACAAVVGHVYPVWLRFRGGKGVATACGAFAVLAPAAMVPAAGMFVAGVWASRYISVGSVLGAVSLAPFAYALDSPAAVVAAAAGVAALIVFRHRSNLTRVWAGTERRVGVRV
jgi:glycerol-3-phosphate acyltransferase PlsY